MGPQNFDPAVSTKPPMATWKKLLIILGVLETFAMCWMIIRVFDHAEAIEAHNRFQESQAMYPDACWPNVRCPLNCMNKFADAKKCEDVCFYDPFLGGYTTNEVIGPPLSTGNNPIPMMP